MIALSNRLPVNRQAGTWRPSAGGLVTALRPVMERERGLWIGWDGGQDAVPSRVDGINADLHPVSLGRTHVQNYYHGFSNRTLWPLFHDLVQTPVFDRKWWTSYVEVNRRFAEAAGNAKLPSDAAPVWWVQDYHLLVLPRLLREVPADGPIGFFLHTPWPPPELFARLPWRREILRGVLGADVVSFHTERYRTNFARTCGRVLDDVIVKGKSIHLAEGREVRTTANPISIDAAGFTEAARGPQVDADLRRLRRQFEGRRLIVGVDRLDYTKGILERLWAFEELLERRSDLRARLGFVQIAVPSRTSVREYRELRSSIEETIGRINGRFTEPGADVPIHYLHRGVPLHRLLAYYCAADVFAVTALKDGMNLVSKEYVTAQAAVDGAGALVLSEFAGAALQLPQALLCNPFDVEGLSHALEHALEMPEEERRRAIKVMAANVARHDVFRWVERELSSLRLGRAGARRG